MVIGKVNVNKVEAYLKRVTEESSRLKILQEELDNVGRNLKSVNFDFVSGKISKEIYEETRKNLAKKKKLLIDKINKKVGDVLVVTGNLSKFIGGNKV